MSTVADIGVNVVANANGATNELDRFRGHAHNTFTGIVGEVESFSHRLHEGLGVLRGFRSITELGFGFGIGRQFFDQVHEGIVHLAEGFHAGQEAGLSFFGSLANGAETLIGVKTKVQELTEALERHKAAQKSQGEGGDLLADLTHTRRLNRFPGLSESEEKKVFDRIKELREQAKSQHTDEQGNADYFKNMRLADELYQAAIQESLRRIRKRVAELNDQADAKDERFEHQLKEQADKTANFWQQWIKDRIAGKPEEKPFSLDAAPANFPGGQHAWEGMSDQQKAQALANKGINDKRWQDAANAPQPPSERQQLGMSRADAGKAQDYGTVEAFKAVEDSRLAMAGMQDKQLEENQKQTALQSNMDKSLTTIATKLGNTQPIPVVDFY